MKMRKQPPPLSLTRLLAHDEEEADGGAHGHEEVDRELQLRVVDGRVLVWWWERKKKVEDRGGKEK